MTFHTPAFLTRAFLTRGLLLLTALLAAIPFAPSALAAPPTPLTVQLDWKPSAQFAGILVAVQNGYYRRQGLAVTLASADTAMDPFAQIAASDRIVGISEAESLLSEKAKGNDIQAFATMMQTTPFCLITLKASGLATFESLRGKRIGLYGDGRRALGELLAFHHMTPADVTLVDIPFSFAPLIAGQVDAMQGYSIDEAVRLTLQGHPVNVIPMSENGLVSYAEVLFASSTLLRGHPDTLVRFLRATRQGWQYAVAHPHRTAQIIVRRFLPGGSLAEQEQSLAQVLPLLNAETHDNRFGQMRVATWQQILSKFQQTHPELPPIPIDSLVNTSILKTLDPD